MRIKLDLIYKRGFYTSKTWKTPVSSTVWNDVGTKLGAFLPSVSLTTDARAAYLEGTRTHAQNDLGSFDIYI